MAPTVKFDQKEFHKHMRGKLQTWEPIQVQLGDNFAVFTFRFKYKCEEALKSLKSYLEYYDYTMAFENERLVIINNETPK